MNKYSHSFFSDMFKKSGPIATIFSVLTLGCSHNVVSTKVFGPEGGDDAYIACESILVFKSYFKLVEGVWIVVQSVGTHEELEPVPGRINFTYRVQKGHSFELLDADVEIFDKLEGAGYTKKMFISDSCSARECQNISDLQQGFKVFGSNVGAAPIDRLFKSRYSGKNINFSVNIPSNIHNDFLITFPRTLVDGIKIDMPTVEIVKRERKIAHSSCSY